MSEMIVRWLAPKPRAMAVLVMLNQRGALTAKEIARSLGEGVGAIESLLDDMGREEWVTGRVLENDGYEITPVGETWLS